jgi:MoxR-like ATPase
MAAIEKEVALKPVTLAATGSWPATRHQFDQRSIWAVKAALAAKRPLLVRGEPGTGKSQLARAAAHLLKRAFIFEVVHARSECHDLQYHFDAVARLGEAQMLGTLNKAGDDLKDLLDPVRFISPGALWWAFNWDNAKKQFEKSNKAARRPEIPNNWRPERGTVLLIDEIDKADIDLPNGLLETLGNGAFTVPYLDEAVCVNTKDPAPLVVITTNEERELPAAFIRRCLVLHLSLPKEDQDLIQWLCKRGRVHFGNRCSETVRKKAAEQLVKDRHEAKRLTFPPPGQAEYLDILRAVIGIAEKDEKKQLEVLEIIGEFALIKNIEGYQQ